MGIAGAVITYRLLLNRIPGGLKIEADFLIILAFQAVFEILYVRKILLMGGSGIPLAPY